MKQKNTFLILSLFLATGLLHAMDVSYGSLPFAPNYSHSLNPIRPTTCPLVKALLTRDSNTLKKLIADGANIGKDYNQVTFLQRLIQNKKYLKQQDYIEIIHLLLPQKDGNLNTPGYNIDPNVLYDLYKKDDAPIVDLLMRFDINVNVKNYCGNTPLYKAVEKNKKHAVTLLLFYNADHEMKNNRNETAYNTFSSETTALLKDRTSVRKAIMPLIQEKEFCGNKIYSALKKREYTGSHKSIKKGITQVPMLQLQTK